MTLCGLKIAKRSALNETHGPEWPLPRKTAPLKIHSIILPHFQAASDEATRRCHVQRRGPKAGDGQGLGGRAQDAAHGNVPQRASFSVQNRLTRDARTHSRALSLYDYRARGGPGRTPHPPHIRVGLRTGWYAHRTQYRYRLSYLVLLAVRVPHLCVVQQNTALAPRAWLTFTASSFPISVRGPSAGPTTEATPEMVLVLRIVLLLSAAEFGIASDLQAQVQGALDDIATVSGYSFTAGFVDGTQSFGVGAGPRSPAGLSPVVSGDVSGTDTMLLGSGTKPYTAAGVLRLVDAGKVRLNDKASEHVDSVLDAMRAGTSLVSLFGPKAASVTVGHLLSMGSGIGDFDVPTFDHKILTSGSSVHAPLGILDYVSSFRAPAGCRTFNCTFVCEPGSCTSYSSTNYVLAGLVLLKHASPGKHSWTTLTLTLAPSPGQTQTQTQTQTLALTLTRTLTLTPTPTQVSRAGRHMISSLVWG